MQVKEVKFETSEWTRAAARGGEGKGADAFDAVFGQAQQQAAVGQAHAKSRKPHDKVENTKPAPSRDRQEIASDKISDRENDQAPASEVRSEKAPSTAAATRPEPIASDAPVEIEEPQAHEPELVALELMAGNQPVPLNPVAENAVISADVSESNSTLAAQSNLSATLDPASATQNSQLAQLAANKSTQPGLPETAAAVDNHQIQRQPATSSLPTEIGNPPAEPQADHANPLKLQAAADNAVNQTKPEIPEVQVELIIAEQPANAPKEAKPSTPAPRKGKTGIAQEPELQSVSRHQASADPQAPQQNNLFPVVTPAPQTLPPNLKNLSAEGEKSLPRIETAAATVIQPGPDKANLEQLLSPSPKAQVPKVPVEMDKNIDQIVKNVHVAASRGESRVQIRLDPPELGALRIEIRQSAAGTFLQLQTGHARTHELLQQSAPQLKAALEQTGIAAVHIDVQLRQELRQDQSGSQGQNYPQNSGGQPGQGGSQHQNPEQGFAGPAFADAPWQREISPDPEPAAVASAAWTEISFQRLDVKI